MARTSFQYSANKVFCTAWTFFNGVMKDFKYLIKIFYLSEIKIKVTTIKRKKIKESNLSLLGRATKHSA